jgi:hypothetical protein
MLKQNDELEAEKRALQEQLEKLKTDLEKKEVEIQELRETVETQKASISVAVADNQSVYQNASLPEDEQTKKFSEFVDAMCIVRPDVEESSVNMEGQFRIWSHTKPKKETFHALKNYLDTRFKPSRLTIQTKNQVVHGYIGVKLKELVYKKKHTNHPTETFLFQVCAFSPCGKILNSTLLTEYQRWKKTVDLPTSDTDLKDLKDYLNDCEYAVKATVWTDRGTNEGYYGLSLRSDEPRHKATSATGKKVEKRTVKENFLITTWETIAKAADAEKFSPAKMSRSIKNKVTFNDEYYYCISEK